MKNYFYIESLAGKEGFFPDEYGVFSLDQEGFCYFWGTKDQAQAFADKKNDLLQSEEVSLETYNMLKGTNPNPKISISEIYTLANRRKQINELDLASIDFIDDDGNSIDISPEIIKEFVYTGLNNMDFITSGFYKIGFGDQTETEKNEFHTQ